MDVTDMPDTRDCTKCCACYMTSSDGQEWPCICRRQSAAVSNASIMKVAIPKPQCSQSLLPHLWSCYMLTLPALRPWWNWINPKTCQTFWCFLTILQNMLWHTWLPNKTVKTFHKFLWQRYILIFRAPAKLLSSWEANFESSIIRELCKLMDIQKVRTSPYHAQTNGQVEQPHQNANVHDREIK